MKVLWAVTPDKAAEAYDELIDSAEDYPGFLVSLVWKSLRYLPAVTLYNDTYHCMIIGGSRLMLWDGGSYSQ